MITETKKQSKIVSIMTEEPRNTAIGVVQLKMGGLRFGESKTPLPIALIFSVDGVLSVVGAVRDIVVAGAAFGRLEFSSHAEAKEIESRWDNGELTEANLTTTVELFGTSSWEIRAVVLKQGELA